MHLAAHHFPAQDPAAPPVILLHGFASSADEDFVSTGWVETLRDSRRSVIAIDLPGHGGSPAVPAPESARTGAVVASILAAVRAVTGAQDFDVIGYSLGSRLAWELPAASPRVRRLVLGGLSPAEPFAGIDHAALARTVAGEPASDPLLGMLAGMIAAPGRDSGSLLALARGLAEEPFEPFEPFATETGGPTIPTLLVAGAADPMTSGVEELAATLPHASVTHVPGDHRAALDGAEFREAAIRFLG